MKFLFLTAIVSVISCKSRTSDFTADGDVEFHFVGKKIKFAQKLTIPSQTFSPSTVQFGTCQLRIFPRQKLAQAVTKGANQSFWLSYAAVTAQSEGYPDQEINGKLMLNLAKTMKMDPDSKVYQVEDEKFYVDVKFPKEAANWGKLFKLWNDSQQNFVPYETAELKRTYNSYNPDLKQSKGKHEGWEENLTFWLKKASSLLDQCEGITLI